MDDLSNREFALMRAGGMRFAIYADETDGITEGLKTTPIPGSPPSILGLVFLRGKMRTVIDPFSLVDGNSSEALASAAIPQFIVSLRGDEQLALAVDSVDGFLPGPVAGLNACDAPSVRGTFCLDDNVITVLDPSRLFEAAMQGMERRRSRTP